MDSNGLAISGRASALFPDVPGHRLCVVLRVGVGGIDAVQVMPDALLVQVGADDARENLGVPDLEVDAVAVVVVLAGAGVVDDHRAVSVRRRT